MSGLFKRFIRPKVATLGGGKWAATHRHRKGGGYRLLGYGINEADRTAVAIYDDVDGTVWVRSKEEFLDGRFMALHQTE